MLLKRLCAVVSRLQWKSARILGFVCLCVVTPGAFAAGYPEHPVRLIVPSPTVIPCWPLSPRLPATRS